MFRLDLNSIRTLLGEESTNHLIYQKEITCTLEYETKEPFASLYPSGVRQPFLHQFRAFFAQDLLNYIDNAVGSIRAINT